MMSRDDMKFNNGFYSLKKYIIEQTGLSFYNDKDKDLMGKFMIRFKAKGFKDCTRYLSYLKSDPGAEAELDNLIVLLTVGETYFFRNENVFGGLKNTILPGIIKRKRSVKKIKIWCAGCATGEEPYSLAIMMRRDFPELKNDWNITIIGTDINRSYLARARQGHYGNWSFRGVDVHQLGLFFTRRGQFQELSDEIKKMVDFQYHNLVKHPFPSLFDNLFALDLIVCRNVLIYFDTKIIKQMIELFENAVINDGWLVVGHSEHIYPYVKSFVPVILDSCVMYHKKRESGETIANIYKPSRPSPEIEIPVETLSFTDIVKDKEREPVENKGGLAELKRLMDRGEFEKAEAACLSLFELFRLNPGYYFYHALIAEQNGNYDSVLEFLKKSIYLDRKFVLSHYQLGLIFQKKGDIAGAKKSFFNALNLLKELEKTSIIPYSEGMKTSELISLITYHMEILE